MGDFSIFDLSNQKSEATIAEIRESCRNSRFGEEKE